MNLKNYYWYFTNVLPHKFCNDIIRYGNLKQDSLGVTGKYLNKELDNESIKDLKKQRDSNVVWLAEKWIYRQILPYVRMANKNAGWNYDIDFAESCQFTKYKLNQHYDWHMDSGENPYRDHTFPEYNGKIRKLSVTCSLSDSSEYKGGELEFNFNHPDKTKKENIRQCKEILPKGSLVVFPSFVYHRVLPVTEGIRYSLVIWNLGNPFK